MVRSIRGACNAADGGTVGSDPAPENIRLTAVAATTECATGMMCTAPPGAKLSESPHHCLDCRRKIHTAIWCGKNWGGYVDSSVCKITANQLSIAGRESIQSIDHKMLTICHNCVNRLKSTATSESTLATTAERRQTLTNNPIATCLWDDVIVTTSRTSSTQKMKKGAPMKPENYTCLQGFRINGVLLPSMKLTRDALMRWAIGKGRSRAMSLNKQKLCEAIVDWKAEHDISVANGTAETVDPIMQRPLRINTKRFLNVIFGPVMKPKLSTCGQALTAMELEDKKKIDEDLFTAVIVEYNSRNLLYSRHAFSNIDNFMDAGTFELFPPDQWEKARKKFGDLFAENEVLFNRWTRSGTHGEFQEMMDKAIAYSEENTNPAMLYLHEYLAQSNNHKLFEICLGLLRTSTAKPTRFSSTRTSGAVQANVWHKVTPLTFS